VLPVQRDAPLTSENSRIDFAWSSGAIRGIKDRLRTSSAGRKAALSLNFSKESPVVASDVLEHDETRTGPFPFAHRLPLP
jgi:hypothetical protein